MGNAFKFFGIIALAAVVGFSTVGCNPNGGSAGGGELQVVAGVFHNIVIKADGSLWAWGGNEGGQLGDGTTTNRSSPVRIGRDRDWASVAAGGAHTVAIRANGSLWAWGGNGQGQIGDGTMFDRSSPVRIGRDTNWASAAAGAAHTLAIRTDGTLWAWGRKVDVYLNPIHDYGNVPVQIGTDANWARVTAGWGHAVAIRTDGTLWAWGWNQTGQLGDTTEIDRVAPEQIGAATNWSYASAGMAHTVAIRTDGSLWAWGNNEMGQIGDGTTIDRNHPVRITVDIPYWEAGHLTPWELEELLAIHWTSVAAGGAHTVAFRADGRFWVWGNDEEGQLAAEEFGLGDSILSPFGMGQWASSASAGLMHTVVIGTNGALSATGSNEAGQLGDGTTTNRAWWGQVALP